jgi:hypothetical protein
MNLFAYAEGPIMPPKRRCRLGAALLRRFDPVLGRQFRRLGDGLGPRQQFQNPSLDPAPIGE